MSINQLIRKYYYVYMLIDPKNNQPFYIGKGFHTRAYAHVIEAQKPKETWTNPHKCYKILKILALGMKIKYKFTFYTSETEAYEEEIKLIAHYGRNCEGGILTNITKGGDCGNPISRSVCLYTKDGQYVTTYQSIAECSRDIGLCSPHKLWTLLADGPSAKHLKTLKGYMFTYKGAPPPSPFYRVDNQPTIIKYKSGECIVFASAGEAAVHVSVAPSTMRNWCNGNKPIPASREFVCFYE